MRAIAVSVGGLAALVLVATALAAVPAGGAHFKGTTSYPVFQGFKDPVSFTVAAGSKSLLHFTFGTFGCFGAGGFPPGKNPYTLPGTLAKLPAIPVTPSGTFSGKYAAAFAVKSTLKTTVVVKGSFPAKKAAKGTLTISQTLGAQKCGPAKFTFTAKTS